MKTKNQTEPFGPFADIPSDQIYPASFSCCLCGQPVRVFRVQTPIVPRVCFHQCHCGPSVVVWEDENQPNARSWPKVIRLARRTRHDVVIFNGNRPLPKYFQGIN